MIHKKLSTLPGTIVKDDIYLVKKPTGVEVSAVTNNVVSPESIPLKKLSTIEGPVSLYHGEVGNFVITNYGTFPSYVIESTDGTIVNNGSSFTFVCSDTAKSSAKITVSGRELTIAINAVKPKAPTIQSPTENSTPSVVGLVLTSDPFSLNYAGGSDTHLSTDWEISTDPNFTTIVSSSYNDTVNKTTYTP